MAPYEWQAGHSMHQRHQERTYQAALDTCGRTARSGMVADVRQQDTKLALDVADGTTMLIKMAQDSQR